MDPITILGAVAAAAQLAEMTEKYCKRAYRFYRDIKDAPAKSKDLREEFSELQSIIQDLSETLITVKTNHSEFGDVISPDFLKQYQDFLAEFASRLKVDRTDIGKRLKWPFSTKQNEEYITKIERFKTTFILSLEKLSVKLSSVQS